MPFQWCVCQHSVLYALGTTQDQDSPAAVAAVPQGQPAAAAGGRSTPGSRTCSVLLVVLALLQLCRMAQTVAYTMLLQDLCSSPRLTEILAGMYW